MGSGAGSGSVTQQSSVSFLLTQGCLLPTAGSQRHCLEGSEGHEVVVPGAQEKKSNAGWRLPHLMPPAPSILHSCERLGPKNMCASLGQEKTRLP